MTQKERQAQSRKEILQASLEEFGTVGYAQATVDSICARRHISKGMMYHYYKGKDDLFLLCAADMFEKLSAFLAAHEPDAPDAQQSAFDGLAAYYQCREAFFAAHPVYWKVFENAMLHPLKTFGKQAARIACPRLGAKPAVFASRCAAVSAA